MFLDCHFYSDVLGKCCSMYAIVPQKVNTQIGLDSAGGRERYPVLYLLHGLSDDHTIWLRRTSIERYVADKPLVVVMPNGDRSFYTDMAHGGRYWTFLSEELPAIVAATLPVSTRREDTFAAGLSMGGYGALKLALRRPDRFAAAGAMSAVTDMGDFLRRMREGGSETEALGFFGGWEVPAEDDIYQLAEKAAALPEAERPKIFHACGTEDYLYQTNIAFRDYMRRRGAFDYTYTEGPGIHNWAFWDRHIQEILAWLPLARD